LESGHQFGVFILLILSVNVFTEVWVRVDCVEYHVLTLSWSGSVAQPQSINMMYLKYCAWSACSTM
jgi:hypothetical protein